MRRWIEKNAKISAVILLPFLLQGCAAIAVADTVVGSTVFVAKTAVKGTVGAGKLVYRGGKAVGNAVTGGNSSSDYSYDSQAYQGDVDSAPSCLNADGSYSQALRDANGEYFCTN